MVDFLVDVYCLGVKNILVREESQYSYAQLLEELRDSLDDDLEQVEPALAKKLVLDAVAYAKSEYSYTSSPPIIIRHPHPILFKFPM